MLLLFSLLICSFPNLSFYYYLEKIRFQSLKDSYNDKVEYILSQLEECENMESYETDLFGLSSKSSVLYVKQQKSSLILFETGSTSTGYAYYSDETAKKWLNTFDYVTIINSNWAIYDMFPLNYPENNNIIFE